MLAFLCLLAQGPDQMSPRLLPSRPAEEQWPGARSGRGQGGHLHTRGGNTGPLDAAQGPPHPSGTMGSWAQGPGTQKGTGNAWGRELSTESFRVTKAAFIMCSTYLGSFKTGT